MTPLPEPWQQVIAELIAKWRANADMLAEGSKGEWPDPAAGMQRACADELEAAVAALQVLPKEQREPERDTRVDGRS